MILIISSLPRVEEEEVEDGPSSVSPVNVAAFTNEYSCRCRP